ncbi:MAG: FAD-binding oxidoreductase [Candidatus Eisenbacteria bacterium]
MPMVHRPTSIEDLCAVFQRMGSERRILRGGGTQFADDCERDGDVTQVVDLSTLDGVIEHRAGDLVVRARAGTTIDVLQRELADRGQRWPLGVAASDRSTLGGLLATDARSARTLRYGRARDWVLGSTLVRSDGKAVRAGGSVVKNVSGYDLTKLYIGSFGSLGALVEVSLKLDPLPESTRVLRMELADLPNSFAELYRPRTTLSAALERDHLVHLLFEGTMAAVDRDVREVTAALPRATLEPTPERFDRRGPCFGAAWLRLRIELPLRAESTLLPSLRASVKPAAFEAHLGCGVAWLVWPEPATAAAREILARATQLSASHGAWTAVEMSAEPLDALPGPHPATLLELNDRIKRAFDPDGLLPPGPLRAQAPRPRVRA